MESEGSEGTKGLQRLRVLGGLKGLEVGGVCRPGTLRCLRGLRCLWVCRSEQSEESEGSEGFEGSEGSEESVEFEGFALSLVSVAGHDTLTLLFSGCRIAKLGASPAPQTLRACGRRSLSAGLNVAPIPDSAVTWSQAAFGPLQLLSPVPQTHTMASRLRQRSGEKRGPARPCRVAAGLGVAAHCPCPGSLLRAQGHSEGTVCSPRAPQSLWPPSPY